MVFARNRRLTALVAARLALGGGILVSACGEDPDTWVSGATTAGTGGDTTGWDASAGGTGGPGATIGEAGGGTTLGGSTAGGLDGSASVDAATDGGGVGADARPPGADARVPADVLGDGFYRMERLDRGLVAVRVQGGVYVGFRAFGTEHTLAEQGELSYLLYRDGAPLVELEDSTNFLDAAGSADSRYQVRARRSGVDGPLSGEVTPLSESYLRIPLQPPAGAYSANDASGGDLDGDGRYDLVLKWEPDNAKDNSQSGVTDNVYLDGLTLAGVRLWRIDLGPNIRAGAHYTQFVVYDLDGDGRAELTVKTAPGTRDGRGRWLSRGPAADDDDGAVYRNGDGYVLSGPEYLTVFDGETGAERATVPFEQARGDVGAWGDSYGNRVDRFLATAAYLDDTGLPSVVMARGYYTRTTLTAWNFRDGALERLWKFDSNETPRDAQSRPFSGQGCHSLSVTNVDDDLPQEIVYGAMSIDHDGRGMCSTGFGHGDALHVSDLVPDRPGQEVFMPHESSAQPAWSVRDARTCETVSRGAITDGDIGRGVAADVLPESPGAEIWASGGTPYTSAASGRPVGDRAPSINFVIHWDADDMHELEDGTEIREADGQVLLRCDACASNNGTKSTPALVADLLGDYREEVIWRESDNRALRLYTTTDVSTRRLYTLMHDPQYRVAVSFQNAGYNQPAQPSFLLSSPEVPVPDMRMVDPAAGD